MLKEYVKKITLGVLSLLTMVNIFSIAAFASEKDKVTIEIVSGDLSQDEIENIEFSDGTKVRDYEYEVIYKNKNERITSELEQYFYAVLFINRDDEVTLRLQPKYNVRTSYGVKENAWNAILKPSNQVTTSSHWRNPLGMKAQYDCHYIGGFISYKEYWNLEPWRTGTSILDYADLDTPCNT